MLAVEKILQEQFEEWKTSKKMKRETESDLQERFMSDIYQIERDHGVTIHTIIQGMTSKDIAKSSKMTGVLENIMACHIQQEGYTSRWTKYDKIKCTNNDYALGPSPIFPIYVSGVSRHMCEQLCGFKEECVGYMFGEVDGECHLRKEISMVDCRKGGENHTGFAMYEKNPPPPGFDASFYSPDIHGKRTFL